eukprot:maker-scaffold_2-snap-gene-18.3-mRNA-1 protein AED:0.02 eAED:0.02 QI:61/1/1/1/1/1/4/75/494
MIRLASRTCYKISNFTHARCFSQSSEAFSVTNPYSGEVVTEIPLNTEFEFTEQVKKAKEVQKWWKDIDLSYKINVLEHMISHFQTNKEIVGKEITSQMGKPLNYAIGEINGIEERTKGFIQMAPDVLQPRIVQQDAQFSKTVHKEAKGVVMSLAPWNYPLLTAVNSIVPALLCGNTVLLSHGPVTPLVSSRFKTALDEAVVKVLKENVSILTDFHLDYTSLQAVIAKNLVDFVSFTGSTKIGQEIYQVVGKNTFIDVTLELGGSDAAFISQFQDESTFSNAVDTIVDGGFFNAGQSCCGIERVFVHEDVYDGFIQQVKELTEKSYEFGNPMNPNTTLGPLAKSQQVDFLLDVVEDAVNKGASVLTGGKRLSDEVCDGFLQPTVLVNCDSSMRCFQEEMFGPLISMAKVSSDEEAIKKMNDSDFGLTGSIFTTNVQQAEKFAKSLQVGTVFMNRADYLDPFLPWQGRKNTGKGCSLGVEGFSGYYNIKNYHFKYL